MIYRFRVAYEEHEDVYRDIDIKASQTFNDLHQIIQQAIGFDNSKSYSFFISDDYWRKEQEISPVRRTPFGESKRDDNGKISRSKKDDPFPKRKVISDFVNDPHQKFIYVFDPEKEWTFLVELIKILPAENKAYPVCVKSIGNSPKQYKIIPPPPPPEEDEEKPKNEKEELLQLSEKNPVEEEGFNPLDQDIEDKTGESTAEDEEGESSLGYEFDDDY